MGLIKILLLIMLMVLFSCSSGNKDAESDGDEMALSGEDADFVVDSEEEEDLDLDEENGDEADEFASNSEEGDDDMAMDEDSSSDENIALDDIEEGSEDVAISDDAPIDEGELSDDVENESSPVQISDSGEQGSYTVENNDTFMLISFKLYGDYSKWREIQMQNGGLSSSNLRVGDVIKYTKPAEEFVWSPQGNPWLIRRGDTLGVISGEVYGVTNRWRDIYNNNKPMIKDPNLIFAGFTLYYIAEREVASE